MTEMMQEVAAELEDVAMLLAGRELLDDSISKQECQVQSESVAAEYQRLELAGEMLEFAPLQPLCSWLTDNTQKAADSPETFIRLQNEGHLYQWAELVAASIRQQDTLLLPELTSALNDPIWPVPIDSAVLQSLLLALVEPKIASTETKTKLDTADTASTTLVDEQSSQYSIAWDPEVHPEILSAFLSDTPDQIVESTALIHKIAKGQANKDEHKLAARLTHTIKGASGVVGVTSMTVFTHQLEEILDYSVDHQLDNDTQELLSASADCLDGMGEAMLNNQPLPSTFDDLLEQLQSTAKQLDTSERMLLEEDDEEEVVFDAPPKKAPKKPVSPVIAETDPLILSTELLASQALFSNSTPKLANKRTSSNEASMRVPISLIDDLLNLAEELVTSTSQVNDRVKKVLLESQQLRQLEERMSTNMDELEYSIDQQFRQVKHQGDQAQEFDQLDLEVYNELHSVHSLLSETIADNRDIERSMQQNLRELSDQLHSQQRINRELNTTILDTRMESLEALTPRLERIVRETCRSTGKKADLIITGSDLAVDTDILKGLTDPLLHLLRNAVDHGIESDEARAAANKPETGKIELSFKQEGRYVTMTLSDDGKGMDADVIYQRALSQGIVTPDQPLTDEQKLQLILQAGLTTRDEVSNISGRGVGMDVVQDAVSRLRGTLGIESILGKNSVIHIRLPLTLVAANTLMASVAGKTVAIPVDSIDRLETLQPGSISFNEGSITAAINDKTYQIRQLSYLLGWGNPQPDSSSPHNVILVDHNQQSYALIVDTVLQPREVVVKSLAPWLSNVPGINGACLLSDGAVAPVLDIPRLFQFDSHATTAHFETVPEQKQSELVMIVDDSLSNRKALSITAEQLGYRTVTAIDGEDALQLLDNEMPDIILSDLEMPRMNGLELAQSVRAMKTDSLLPFIMITSRATNKHRQQAKLAGVNDYLVKPVDRETLQNYLEKWLN